jgi:predicted Fe-Mo cluster-binding NifX family protein
MKIALVSDDGTNVSKHFGRAQYVVFTLENGRVTGNESRTKPGHMHSVGQHESDSDYHHGPEADHRHETMISPVADCEALVTGGIGAGAYEAIRSQGIKPIITDIKTAHEAAKAYAEGRIVDHAERMHR